MRIELKPCYPEGQTLEQQVEKVKGEYEELVDAIENESWQNQVREALDVAQTIVGYMDILVYSEEPEGFQLLCIAFDEKPEDCLKLHLNFWVETINKFKHEYLLILVSRKVAQRFIEYFWKLICDSCNENREEIAKKFLEEHQAKLESRRKEWNVGSDNG